MKKIYLLLFFACVLANSAFSQRVLPPIEPATEINCHITMTASNPVSTCPFIIPHGRGVSSEGEISGTPCLSAKLEKNSMNCVVYTLNYDDWVFMGKPDKQVSTITAYKISANNQYYDFMTYNVIVTIQH